MYYYIYTFLYGNNKEKEIAKKEIKQVALIWLLFIVVPTVVNLKGIFND